MEDNTTIVSTFLFIVRQDRTFVEKIEAVDVVEASLALATLVRLANKKSRRKILTSFEDLEIGSPFMEVQYKLPFFICKAKPSVFVKISEYNKTNLLGERAIVPLNREVLAFDDEEIFELGSIIKELSTKGILASLFCPLDEEMLAKLFGKLIGLLRLPPEERL